MTACVAGEVSVRRRALFGAVFVSAFLAAPAHALDEPRWSPGKRTTATLKGEVVAQDKPFPSDGVYGRLDGDLSLGFGLGLDLGAGVRGAAVGRALYYHSVGLLLGYADDFGSDAALSRLGFAGVELRPLFLIRWSQDLEIGSPLFDLTLDSLCLELGGYAGQTDSSSFGDPAGFQGALGFGIPLSARAQGPWIEARGAFRSGVPDAPFAVLVLVSLYGSVVTPAVK